MTTEQIKTRINKALDNAPEDVLSEVLDYINELMEASDKQSVRTKRLKRMLEEDSDLLQRLAQ